MKSIDQFVFYKLGHYLRLHLSWDEMPSFARNLLIQLGSVENGLLTSSLDDFKEKWLEIVKTVQKSGQEFVIPVDDRGKILPSLRQYLKEQEECLLQQVSIFNKYPFLPRVVWQDLIATWKEEQEGGHSSKFLLKPFVFPVGIGLTRQKLVQARKDYKTRYKTKTSYFTPSVLQLSNQLLHICELLKPLDEKVDKLYMHMDTLFWAHRRQKSNDHQLSGVDRQYRNMTTSLDHALREMIVLKDDPHALSLAQGFMSYVNYFEHPQWLNKEIVEPMIVQASEEEKRHLLNNLDEVLLTGAKKASQ